MEPKPQDIKDKVQDKAAEVKAKAEDAAQDVKGKVEGAANDLKDKAKTALNDSGASDDLQSLRDDLQALRSDVASLMGSLKGAASSTAKSVTESLLSGGGQVANQAKDVLHTARDKGGELTANLEERVMERPLMSVLVAFGLGLVLSRMLDRR
ncbi:MAG: hypothetical protein C4332_15985 [Meiothermus sp.]